MTNVSTAWAHRAEELAVWTFRRLVNRVDVWGAYRPESDWDNVYVKKDGTIGKLGRVKTDPAVRFRGYVFLNEARLIRHFHAQDRGEVLGLHTTSPENMSKWGAVEIDWHGECSSDPAVNWIAARWWWERLCTFGFFPLLLDSNGRGGYHLIQLFREPVPTQRVYSFLRWLIRDYRKVGLPAAPETFPKQARLRESQVGNWLRLPGRHHTAGDHWSRVWDGSTWLEGNGAIDFMLALPGDSPALIPAGALVAEGQPQQLSRPRRSVYIIESERI